MGQTGNRGSQEALGSESDERGKDTSQQSTPSATLTSRIVSFVNELRFALPLRQSRDTSPCLESNPKASKVQTPMRFVSSDFRTPDGTQASESPDPQRASTLPSSIRACRELSSSDFPRIDDSIEMATLRPRCTCWTHKTVCLVGELKRFRLHDVGDDEISSDPVSEEQVPMCNCGEVCKVHGIGKTCDAAVLVDNIEFDLGEATLEESSTDDDMDFYCNSETLPLSSDRNDGAAEAIPADKDACEVLTHEEGYLRIILNLTQPISVVAGTRPPSIYDVIKHKKRATAGLNIDSMDNRTLTSFYMPRGTVKIIHISNDTTAHDVIAALLRRFRVVDSPMKFALYERQLEEGVESSRVKMRRMADEELPLSIGPEKQILLQENDHQDVEWDAFTIPELSNFLLILNREEDEYRRRLRMRYRTYQKKILDRMEFLRPGSTASRYDYVLQDLESSKCPAEC